MANRTLFKTNGKTIKRVQSDVEHQTVRGQQKSDESPNKRKIVKWAKACMTTEQVLESGWSMQLLIEHMNVTFVTACALRCINSRLASLNDRILPSHFEQQEDANEHKFEIHCEALESG